MQAAPVGRQALGQVGIGQRQDLGRQQTRIGAIANGHGGDRDAGGHLHDRMQRIHPG